MSQNERAKSKMGDVRVGKKGDIMLSGVIISALFVLGIAYAASARALPVELGWLVPSGGPAGAFILMVFLINPLIKTIRKGRGLNAKTLLLSYVILMMGCLGIYQSKAYDHIVAPQLVRFKSPIVAPHLDRLPSLLMVHDEEAIKYWVIGGAPIPWKFWIAPIITWTIFYVLLAFAGICLAVLVRKRWNEHEKLAYPIAMPFVYFAKAAGSADEGKAFFRDSGFLIGFGISGFLGLLIILKRYYPIVPALDPLWPGKLFMKFFSSVSTLPPWTIQSNLQRATWAPAFIGIGYFVPTNILLSTWVMTFVNGAFRCFEASRGRYPILNNADPAFTGISVLTMILVNLWFMRGYFKDVWRQICAPKDLKQKEEDGLSYRTAIIGFLGVWVFFILFTVYGLKVKAIYPLIVFPFLNAVILGFGRLRAESGIGYNAGWAGENFHYLSELVGSKVFHPESMVGWFSFYSWSLEGGPGVGGVTPTTLEAFKFAEETGMRNATMIKAVLMAYVFGLISSVLFRVSHTYELGSQLTGAGATQWQLERSGVRLLEGKLDKVQPLLWLWYIAGIVVITGLFSFLYARFSVWPLHPAGVAVATSYMRFMTFSFFVAWIIKTLVLRFGGMYLYRKVAPAFVGFMVGDLVTQIIGALIIVVLGR